MINYEITKIVPKQLFMQVRYYSDGNQDFNKNFVVTDFSESNVQAIAADGARAAKKFWSDISNQPESVAIKTTGSVKDVVIVPPPSYNSPTEALEPDVVETDTTITKGWKVRSKTESELADDLNLWRDSAKITMRQCRLALLQQGLLDTVVAAIAALPEPDKSVVETEWEYSASVERNSPWVSSMSAAINLTEIQMDEMFKLAETL